MTDPTSRRVMLLDTASMYFRAFFGVPEITAPDGTPVNAVRGLLDFIARLVEQYEPTDLVCCWDVDWRPAWRVELLPSYKAHRVEEPNPVGPDVEEVPDPLAVQIPLIEQVLAALGIAVRGAAGYEADDVIGTLATAFSADGMPVNVVTGDRDLFQLVDDASGVRVLYIARGVGNHERVDEAWVRAKYGVGPAEYADFATLRGDASDGLPGVPGVGEKTAAALISAYGHIPGVQAAAADPTSKITPAVRRRILEAAEYLAVAPTVVAVARDVPLDRARTVLPRTPERPDELADLAERYNLSGPLDRLVGVLAGRS